MSLPQELATLEANGLILLASLAPEVEYLFRHALIQEAAYQSLVRANRRMLHQIVGESLESAYPARLDSAELAPVLARHFAEAGDPARALHYYALAGRAAAQVYANAEAIHNFKLALEIATDLPGGEEAADLFLRLGHALELSAEDVEALANYEAMQAWAAERGDRKALLAALIPRATIYVKPSVQINLPLGYDLSQQALALARELGDRPAEARVLWNLLQYYQGLARNDEALEYGERALVIAREQGLRETTAYVLTDLLKVYFFVNRLAQATAALEEARDIWRELGVLNMLADNLGTTSMMQVMVGQYAAAVAASDEALRVSRTIGNVWNEAYALFMVDMVHFDRGDVGLALATAEACRRLSEQAGFAEGLNQMYFDLPLMYAYLGALPRALEAARVAQARAEAQAGGILTAYLVQALVVQILFLSGRLDEAEAALEASSIPRDIEALKREFPLTCSFLAMVQAELAVARGEREAALALMEDLGAFLRANGTRLFFPDFLALKGRILRGAGRRDEARAALEEARALAEELGSRRSLWEILAELAGLADERDEAEAAVGLRRRAAEIVGYIAEHIGQADLREAFLRRADVSSLLRQTGQPADY